MHDLIYAAIVLFVLYALFHRRRYRGHRRAGLTIRESLPGPFRTRISISKHWGQ